VGTKAPNDVWSFFVLYPDVSTSIPDNVISLAYLKPKKVT
jgi:hypothetical protein